MCQTLFLVFSLLIHGSHSLAFLAYWFAIIHCFVVLVRWWVYLLSTYLPGPSWVGRELTTGLFICLVVDGPYGLLHRASIAELTSRSRPSRHRYVPGSLLRGLLHT